MSLSKEQLDALAEVVNIGVGRAASSLHDLVDRHIELCVPRVEVCHATEVGRHTDARRLDTSVVQCFSGAINGHAVLAFPEAAGVALAKLVDDAEVEGDELDFDLAGTLEEIGNIVLNGVLGSLANVFDNEFRYTVPTVCVGSLEETLSSRGAFAATDTPTCLLADAHFSIAESDIRGSLLLVFNTAQLPTLLSGLLCSVGA